MPQQKTSITCHFLNLTMWVLYINITQSTYNLCNRIRLYLSPKETKDRLAMPMGTLTCLDNGRTKLCYITTCHQNRLVLYLFQGQQRSMAGHGGCCIPLEHCFHRWGHLHLWLSLVSRTSLWKRRHIDLIGFLLRLKSKLFEVHQFTDPCHLTLMNDESRLGELQLMLSSP